MTSIQNLKGFSYPLTPNGVSSIVGDLPWHYATEYLSIVYRTDPNALAQYLPEPLEAGPEPGVAYVAFSRWWSLWDNQPEMAFTNPERTQPGVRALGGLRVSGNTGSDLCPHLGGQ